MANRVVTRYGPRYGRTTRERLAKAESGYQGKQECPYCAYKAVKRLAAGIWYCTKCKSKFASKAYQLAKPEPVKSRAVESDV
ncbi:MAG: 50S ribosomal protein L37ae [Candidatus Woesearchaeota archaeon]|nr:50S ribosomal protein L37ae [Candidatus Woesearchaeota archaeon]